VSPLNATVNGSKLELTPTTSLLINDTDTITIPANSIKFVGEATSNALIKWNFRVGVNTYTGYSKFVDNQNASFYPNPATDKIVIQHKAQKTLLTTVFNLAGVEIKRALTSNGDEFTVKELSKGLYVLKIGENSHKLIIK
ncbi:T9SS type A sorting domain-containing protein, partial [bacterium]|nr:T9SS type A sorting domain-containing protein [bacterium]